MLYNAILLLAILLVFIPLGLVIFHQIKLSKKNGEISKTPSSRFKALGSFGVIAILIWFASMLPWYMFTLTDEDKGFAVRIANNLRNVGDTVLMGEIVEDGWSSVCIHSYWTHPVKHHAALRLGISEKDVTLEIGPNDKAKNKQWGYYFLYPPNRVKYFRINRGLFTATSFYTRQMVECFERENKPYLERIPTSGWGKHLRLKDRPKKDGN